MSSVGVNSSMYCGRYARNQLNHALEQATASEIVAMMVA